jgi:Bacterial capsule synthesis protein PGA_cap
MKMETMHVRRGVLVAVLGLALGAGGCLWIPAMIGQAPAGRANEQAPKRDWTQDLQMKIEQPFTLASVGDLIIIRPASQYDDPGFQAAIKVIRDADVGFGNFESMIRDERNFTGPLGGMFGTKEVAADLQAMGFKIVNRAGNHLMDSNQEGLFETMRIMEQAGLVYGGAGRDLEDARSAHYLETPKGRVGIVGMYSEVSGGQSRLSASYRVGNTGGRPGLNAINLTESIIVTSDQLAALKKVRDAVYEHRTEYSNPVDAPASEPTGELQLFGTLYKVGNKPGGLTYQMNAGDLRDTLRSIRNGKEYADFMIATIHAHQGDTVLQPFLYEDHPPDFLIQLAHDAIDSGADVFVGHGPHLLRGIEIYKGKPIFYDLGEFFREWDWGCDCDTDPTATETPAEMTTGRLMARDVIRPVNYESAIAVTKYNQGKLVEVRIYPIESRYAGPISQRGIPRIAPPEVAQQILQRLQKLSEPFGTEIAIEGNVGVIHVGK